METGHHQCWNHFFYKNKIFIFSNIVKDADAKISRSYLQKQLKENSDIGPSLGRKPVFSVEEGKCLKEHVIHHSKPFYRISRQENETCTYDYALKDGMRGSFNKDKRSTNDDCQWSFMKRNPLMAFRKVEPTSINRITPLASEICQSWWRGRNITVVCAFRTTGIYVTPILI